MQEHLQSLSKVQSLVESIVGHTGHPHAIDGNKLRGCDLKAANLPAGSNISSSSTAVQANVDILLLLQVMHMLTNSSCLREICQVSHDPSSHDQRAGMLPVKCNFTQEYYMFNRVKFKKSTSAKTLH